MSSSGPRLPVGAARAGPHRSPHARSLYDRSTTTGAGGSCRPGHLRSLKRGPKPRRGGLAAWLHPGPDSDLAAGHAEPIGVAPQAARRGAAVQRRHRGRAPWPGRRLQGAGWSLSRRAHRATGRALHRRGPYRLHVAVPEPAHDRRGGGLAGCQQHRSACRGIDYRGGRRFRRDQCCSLVCG
jgi:hypothetical protein